MGPLNRRGTRQYTAHAPRAIDKALVNSDLVAEMQEIPEEADLLELTGVPGLQKTLEEDGRTLESDDCLQSVEVRVLGDVAVDGGRLE